MIYGDIESDDSTRPERGGRVGILAVITHIAKTFNLSKGHVTVLIDHQQDLKYGTSPRQGDGPFKHLTDDYDLRCWASIFEQDLKRKNNVLLTYQHIYSHQDNPKKLMKVHPDLNIKITSYLVLFTSKLFKENSSTFQKLSTFKTF